MQTITPRFKRRFLREMKRLVDSEERTLRRYRTISWLSGIIGGIIIGLVISSIAVSGSSVFWWVLLAIVVAYVCGCSTIYWVAYRQWPLLKKYVDPQLVRDDFDNSAA